MITKEKIIEILSNYSSYADSSLGNIIQEEKHDIIAEDIMSKLRQPPVSGRSELLLAFGKFIDEDCDLLGKGYIEEMVKKFEASNSH